MSGFLLLGSLHVSLEPRTRVLPTPSARAQPETEALRVVPGGVPVCAVLPPVNKALKPFLGAGAGIITG
jgi:hypothetical protein